MLSQNNFTFEDYLFWNKISASLMFPIYVFAMLGNCIIVAATIKSSQLRATCSIIIAIQAACEAIYPISAFMFMFFALTEQLHTYQECYWIQFVPLAAANIAMNMMPMVALDRCLSFGAPLWYRRKNAKLYICCLLTFPVAYDIFLKVLGYQYANEELVVCVIPTGLAGVAARVWSYTQGPVAVSVLVLYVAIRIYTKSVHIQSMIIINLNKSLQKIMFVYLCGYTVVAAVNFLGVLFSTNPYVINTLSSLSGIFAAINAASPVVILYLQSDMYRKEIDALIKKRPVAVFSTT
uniref:G_PROTEIN_RECEP_F1_2 domain-containing protein n=1 Tax=Steinernema glaseri TaxID=37863 RepID=A0A1I7Z873_9BILA